MLNYIKLDLFLQNNFQEAESMSNREKVKVKSLETGPDLSHLSLENRERVNTLRKDFETLKLSEKFVGGMEWRLRTALLKDGDPKDREYHEIAEKIKKYQWELKQYWAQWAEIQKELSQLLGEVQTEIKKLSPQEVNALKSIDNKDFLNIPPEKRLQYITKNHIDSSEVASWDTKEIDFTFSFEGQFNRELYLKTTAWQVLPKEVGNVIVWGKTYSRTNVWGEFFTLGNERLTIHEWTKIEIGALRTAQDIEQMNTINTSKISEYLKNNTDAHPKIVSEAINRGIDPKFANIAFGDLVKNTPDEQVMIVLEDAFTEFDRIRWDVEASITELPDLKYDENLSIWILQKFSPDKWKDKAELYWFSQDKIENFVKVSNTKIDFSSIENWDMKTMIEKTAENLWVSSKIIQSILKQESNWNMSATRFEKHVYDRELRKWSSPEDAKLLSTSFWWFQIMGFNHKVCWYNSVSEFVDAMKTPENQFNAFANFIKANPVLHSAMKWDTPNFEKIAYYYNWPKYAQNNYDNKIKAHFYA